MCEITLLTSLCLLGLYAAGRFFMQGGLADSVFAEPDITLWMAGITALYSLGALTIGRKYANFWLGLIAYILASLTITSLVALTGNAHSPFIALWLMVGVFAALFGLWTLVAAGVITNVYVIYWLFTVNPMPGWQEIVLLFLVVEAPLLASFLIWHKQSVQDGGKDESAFSALAQQLSQVANKSEIVINSIADGVVAIDQAGIVQLVNPAGQTILGWPKQDAIGLDYKSVIQLANQKGEPIPDELSPIRQVMLSDKPMTNNNLMLVTKSGKKLLVSLAVSPVGGEGGKAQGAIAVFRDITREKEEERQKGEFISTASHEMRTPVAAIEGYLGLAMNPQTATIDDKARLYLQKAHESTQHLGRLFQDLLTVSKAEDSRLVVRPTAIDATSFTREIVESLQPKAKDKGLMMLFTPGSPDTDGNRRVQPVFYMLADPDNMREVISNLCDNAIKYTKQGSVTVDISGDEHNVSISVTDSGIGIPPEDVPHLFQKFYRVDNSDTREIGGTGLGLYICRRLTEANNGRINVNSMYGKGSTFTIELPRLNNDQATDIMSTQAAAAPTSAMAPANPAPITTAAPVQPPPQA